MIFYTQFSKYEIDTDCHKIRRLSGAAPPTERQGKDGEWKKYYEITPLEEGTSPLIWWSSDGKATMLSVVTMIEKEVA